MSKGEQRNMRRLTTGELFGSKPIIVIATIIAVFVAQVFAIYMLLYVLFDLGAPVNEDASIIAFLENPSNVTMIRIIIAVVLVVMLVIAVALSLAIIKRVSKKVPVEHASEAERRTHKINTSFKWRKVYTLVLAYFVFAGAIMLAPSLRNIFTGFTFISILSFVLSFIAPFVVVFLFVKYFNIFMIKITRTNYDLIKGIKHGHYNAEIPNEYRNAKDISAIIKILEGAWATTLDGAISFLRKRVSLQRNMLATGGNPTTKANVSFRPETASDVFFLSLVAPFAIVSKVTDFFIPSTPKSNYRQNQNHNRKPDKKTDSKKEEVYWPPYF